MERKNLLPNSYLRAERGCTPANAHAESYGISHTIWWMILRALICKDSSFVDRCHTVNLQPVSLVTGPHPGPGQPLALSVYWSNNDYKLECQRSLITVLLVNCCVEGGCHGAQLVKVACKVLHGDVGAERRDSIRQQHSCCGSTEDLYVDRLSTGQRRWNHAVCVSTSTHFTITVVRKLVIK